MKTVWHKYFTPHQCERDHDDDDDVDVDDGDYTSTFTAAVWLQWWFVGNVHQTALSSTIHKKNILEYINTDEWWKLVSVCVCLFVSVYVCRVCSIHKASMEGDKTWIVRKTLCRPSTEQTLKTWKGDEFQAHKHRHKHKIKYSLKTRHEKSRNHYYNTNKICIGSSCFDLQNFKMFLF